METIASKDGTKIAYEKSGSGPALLIVGGSLADHAFYAPLAAELADGFTVYNFDRRGRGQSGDTLPYSPEHEVEDVAALVAAAGSPVVLYGHSVGSALALRAVAAGVPVAKLVLVDPPYTPRGNDDDSVVGNFAEEAARVQSLHDEGRHRDNVIRFLSGMGLPTEAVEGMLSSPGGDTMLANAQALPYDYALLGDSLVPVELARQVTVPTTVMAAAYAQEAVQQLAGAIVGATLKALETPTHEMAPAQLAAVIREVL